MKRIKLDARGFSHDIIIILFVVIFAIAGVGYLVASHAAQSTDTNLGMMSGTSPSMSGNIIAFQSNVGTLYIHNIQTGQSTNTRLVMMSGTSPSILGNVVAIQTIFGTLWTYNTQTGQSTNTYQGMNAHSSPSVFGTNIAFESNTCQLFISNGQPYQATNTQQGMQCGTSPSMSGNVVAFQSNVGTLYIHNIQTGQSTNTRLVMMSGTSPSILGNVVAIQTIFGTLWTYNTQTGQSTNTYQGMNAHSSPSVFGTNIAFESNTCQLFISNGQPYQATNTQQGMQCGTSPSMSWASIAFESNTYHLFVYTLTPTAPRPTATLTGPSSVTDGDSPTLNYTSTNATNCSINGVGVATSGSYAAPEVDSDTTYVLICVGPGGSATSLKTVASIPINYVEKDNALDPVAGIAAAGQSKAKGYYYNEPFESSVANVISASARLYQAAPYVQGNATNHSLSEIGVFNESNHNFKTINGVEFGWIVSGGSSKSRLFVYNVINGYNSTQTSHGCYNRCGFVSTSRIKPGHVISPGSTSTYKISYNAHANRWELYYNGSLFGYFPESQYQTYSGRSFTYGNDESTWGEVYNTGGNCIEMGNGRYGDKPGAANISGFNVSFDPTIASINPLISNLIKYTVSNPYDYNVGNKTTTSFSYGGPGGSGCR